MSAPVNPRGNASRSNNNPRHPNRKQGQPRYRGSVLKANLATIAATPGASAMYTIITTQIPLRSTPSPHHKLLPIRVLNADTLGLARSILHDNPTSTGKVCVLNLANASHPAGSWNGHSSTTQEEALCASSTLYATLPLPIYPWANEGKATAIYSRAVAITHDVQQRPLPAAERDIVSVISIAAQRFPTLTPDGQNYRKNEDLQALRNKIRMVLWIAACREQTRLVLGALGCGAFKNPPRVVAQVMRDVLLSSEFAGWFEEVVFAILVPRGSNGAAENLKIFKEVFESANKSETKA